MWFFFCSFSVWFPRAPGFMACPFAGRSAILLVLAFGLLPHSTPSRFPLFFGCVLTVPSRIPLFALPTHLRLLTSPLPSALPYSCTLAFVLFSFSLVRRLPRYLLGGCSGALWAALSASSPPRFPHLMASWVRFSFSHAVWFGAVQGAAVSYVNLSLTLLGSF